MTDTTNLMERARRLDDLSSPDFKEWLGLARQADRLRRDLSNVRAQGRFTAAVAQHGSPSEAMRAARFELEALSERLRETAVAGSDVNQDRRELDALLNPVVSRLMTKERELHGRKAALEGERGEIERARNARKQAIENLIEAGLPRRLADLNAKPPIADIEAMEHELSEIPSEIEHIRDSLCSYAAKAELYLAEITDEEEVA